MTVFPFSKHRSPQKPQAPLMPGQLPDLPASTKFAFQPVQPSVAGQPDPRRPATDYSPSRFSGIGPVTTLAEATAREEKPNPVITRLTKELARVSAITRPRDGMPENRESWAVTWRRWAIADLDETVEASKRTFVIYRGEVYPHRLFLGRAGRQLLAVQPQAPRSSLRYTRLQDGMTLEELYGPFARLSDSPRG
ncbi:hypothetical protein [Paracraurococcus ruber]|uniref:Uncharacterized protein n=1 Tax=Paracraurococcus ruber TaxID=77675 RepID=A0ABS1CQQ7_9PROT|nr:hypothetical protein [Paracraurococcus ruber]MBK1656632.1 hypothetical protein [Paracraurococcus ruber]TDG33744.1 hypothetical protein E2C05_02700 [Paracraurococcus ruber]